MKRPANPLASVPRRARDLVRDRRGIAAVEFAFIVPIMLTMYLGTLEMSVAVDVNKKVSRVASTVADLVTQNEEEVTKSDLESIMKIGEAVLFPYTSAKPDIVITAINVDTSYPLGGKVAWSRRYDEGTFKSGPPEDADIAVPTELQTDGSFLIKVETSLDYIPVVAWLIGDSVGSQKDGVSLIEMSERYYLRPRLGNFIDCTNC